MLFITFITLLHNYISNKTRIYVEFIQIKSITISVTYDTQILDKLQTSM